MDAKEILRMFLDPGIDQERLRLSDTNQPGSGEGESNTIGEGEI